MDGTIDEKNYANPNSYTPGNGEHHRIQTKKEDNQTYNITA